MNRNSLGITGRYPKDIVTSFIGDNETGISFNILTKKGEVFTGTSTTKGEEFNKRRRIHPRKKNSTKKREFGNWNLKFYKTEFENSEIGIRKIQKRNSEIGI